MKDCFIYGVLGGFIGTLYMGWLVSSKWTQVKEPSLAVVDMKVLISKKSQQVAKNQPPEKSNNSLPIREAAAQLKEDLSTFATIHNLILLTKGVVISGDVPDKTEEILEAMEKGDGHP